MFTKPVPNHDDETPITSRMPNGLVEEIQGIADDTRRSRSKTIVLLLEKGIAAYRLDGVLGEKPANKPPLKALESKQILNSAEIVDAIQADYPEFAVMDILNIISNRHLEQYDRQKIDLVREYAGLPTQNESPTNGTTGTSAWRGDQDHRVSYRSKNKGTTK